MYVRLDILIISEHQQTIIVRSSISTSISYIKNNNSVNNIFRFELFQKFQIACCGDKIFGQFPEVENTLSVFAPLAGMARIAMATVKRMGKPSL